MDLPRALAYSRYATRLAVAQPALLDALTATLGAPFAWDAARADVAAAVAADDAVGLARTLRQLRQRVFVHTLARDLTGRALLAEVCADITTLAETALGAAVTFHHRALAARHGEPIGTDGTAQQLIVIGMGKLGGGELNVSSDVDLVFVYPEEGETTGPRRIANREFFDLLGRRVIAALHDVTEDGYVFRVDMRLRPYGDSGPLTSSFAALEQYLITQGRAWERYAWLKARALTGKRHAELDAIIAPFVYRKYLDFDAYDGLRDVHRQIRDQAQRKGYGDDIKLGPGGIREIEFIVQAMQLVRGGREPALRVRGTLPALAALEARALLPAGTSAGLRDAYVFLRDVEHRLQYRDDQQTQKLPTDAVEFVALAEAMDHPSPASFAAALARHRGVVDAQFASVFGSGDGNGDDADAAAPFVAVWEEPTATETHRALLADAGFSDPDALLATLAATRASARYLTLPALSRQRLDTLVPQLLSVAATHPGAAGRQPVFMRLLALLDTVARRSAYLALVIEHPPLLPRLANLMGASAWAASYLTRHPLLLDELLDAGAVLAEPDWNAWRDELARQLADHAGDNERQMDVLRHFQQAQTFRLLVQDIAGRLTVERLADHLSALADLVLQATLDCCWRHANGAGAPAPRFAIIGYGKLGGKELGYASDLDLVFLYDVADDEPDADTAQQRYARLAQRINTWLTSTTSAGQLYDSDLRLRPDGASGLLVSSLAAFRRYQREQAWTWEHQALTRARFVAGDRAIGDAFEAERDAILRLPRDRAKLAADVVSMRRKMHEGHPNPTPRFDVKHDAGGMVDIEFIVQYLVLAHAIDFPALTRNAGNIALIGIAGECRLVPTTLAVQAADAYREFRRAQHAERLTGAPHARVDPAPHAEHRAAVRALWGLVLGNTAAAR
jgi:glutamate-ammonia-ligase adenylyltransferase